MSLMSKFGKRSEINIVKIVHMLHPTTTRNLEGYDTKQEIDQVKWKRPSRILRRIIHRVEEVAERWLSGSYLQRTSVMALWFRHRQTIKRRNRRKKSWSAQHLISTDRIRETVKHWVQTPTVYAFQARGLWLCRYDGPKCFTETHQFWQPFFENNAHFMTLLSRNGHLYSSSKTAEWEKEVCVQVYVS